jgi:hypothetical protein
MERFILETTQLRTAEEPLEAESKCSIDTSIGGRGENVKHGGMGMVLRFGER